MLGWFRKLFGDRDKETQRREPTFTRASSPPIRYTVTDRLIEYEEPATAIPRSAGIASRTDPPAVANTETRASSLKSYIAIDCETTGLSPDDGDRIVSFGLVSVPDTDGSGEVSLGVCSLVFNPDRKSHWAARKKHGLSDRFLSFQPRFTDHAADLADLLRGKHVVGHNVDFDLKFLASEFARAGVNDWKPATTSCTMRLFQQRYPGERRSLDNTCTTLGIDLSLRGDKHHALVDAILAAKAFAKLTSKVSLGSTDSIPTKYSNEREVPPVKRGRPPKVTNAD